MLEFVTEAIVLDKKPLNERDSRVVLYTKDFGKVTARAISCRKITSKLNAHLEPLSLSLVRLVYKNEYRLTDALTLCRFAGEAAAGLRLTLFIDKMTGEESDSRLWDDLVAAFKSGKAAYAKLLQNLGFDPFYAVCDGCGGRPDYFAADDLSFWCRNCRQLPNLKI